MKFYAFVWVVSFVKSGSPNFRGSDVLRIGFSCLSLFDSYVPGGLSNLLPLVSREII